MTRYESSGERRYLRSTCADVRHGRVCRAPRVRRSRRLWQHRKSPATYSNYKRIYVLLLDCTSKTLKFGRSTYPEDRMKAARTWMAEGPRCLFASKKHYPCWVEKLFIEFMKGRADLFECVQDDGGKEVVRYRVPRVPKIASIAKEFLKQFDHLAVP